MICGAFDKGEGGVQPRELMPAIAQPAARDRSAEPAEDAPAARTHRSIAPQSNRFETIGAKSALSVQWTGQIYNRRELLALLGLDAGATANLLDRDLFLALYRVFGRDGVARINGRFAFAVYDRDGVEVVLGRDHLGIETLYYYEDSKQFVFGSRISAILEQPRVQKQLNQAAMWRFLAFNYNPAWDTFFTGIRKVRPGTIVSLRRDGAVEQRFWYLSFQGQPERTIPEYCAEIRDLMRDAVSLRLAADPRPGIFLSGGMDSSSVAGIACDLVGSQLTTFSYRCLGQTDESAYARLMADHCRSDHHEVVYRPSDVQRIEDAVGWMDEPFCNAGIVNATWLLGEAARGRVSSVFSGDGGDEVFGGHPVYGADQVAAGVERVPRLLRSPLLVALRGLPDSEAKLSLAVKLKRFGEGLEHSARLATQRWRIYYRADELRRLVDLRGLTDQALFDSLYRDVLAMADEADGRDPLSRSLYADFQSELGFSLRRMDLLRNLDVTPHFPLLDRRLVEYTATIPARLKFRSSSDTKYIQHLAMDGVLPAEIVHRKDKLGHSIPFKNWLRTEPAVKQFVRDVLSPDRLKARGLIAPAYAERLWTEHQEHRRNNAHRLWSLVVLELWLTAHGV